MMPILSMDPYVKLCISAIFGFICLSMAAFGQNAAEFKDESGNIVARIDSQGNLFTYGNGYDLDSTSPPSGAQGFSIYATDGVTLNFFIHTSGGATGTKGDYYYRDRAIGSHNTPNPVLSTHENLWQDGSNYLASVDVNGKFYLKGRIFRYSGDPEDDVAILLREAALFKQGKASKPDLDWYMDVQLAFKLPDRLELGEPNVAQSLCYTYHILKGDIDSNTKKKLFKYMINRCLVNGGSYYQWDTQGGVDSSAPYGERIHSNKAIRKCCGFATTGIIILKDHDSLMGDLNGASYPYEGRTNVTYLRIAQEFVRKGFLGGDVYIENSNSNPDPTVGALGYALDRTDYRRNFSTEGYYTEGPNYGNVAMLSLGKAMHLYNLYRISGGTFQSLHTRVGDHVKFLAETMRSDGRYFASNESGMDTPNYLPLLYPDMSSDQQEDMRFIQERLRSSDSPGTGLASSAINADVDAYLGLAIPANSTAPESFITYRKDMFRNAGQIYIGSSYNLSSPSYLIDDSKHLNTIFINEGGWDHENGEDDWRTWMGTNFFTPDKASASAAGIGPRSQIHKRMNDSHFEMRAYGRDLIIGSMYTTNDDDANGIYLVDVHKQPGYYNMLAVDTSGNLRYPKTEFMSNRKISFIGSKLINGGGPNTDANKAYLYCMHTDLYKRFVLWARDRYFIVYDILVDSSGEPDSTTKVLKQILNLRGSISTGTSGGHPYAIAGYKEFRGATAGSATAVVDDSNIQVVIYPGHSTTVLDAFTSTGLYLDTGPWNTYTVNGPYDWRTRTEIKTKSGQNQYMMPVLYWPRDLNNMNSTLPTLTWSNIANGKQVQVAYNNTEYGSNVTFTDTWDLTKDFNETYINNGFVSSEITVTSPNGGETKTRNTSITVTWTASAYMSDVKIYLVRNNLHYAVLSTGTTNDGSQSVTLPDVPVGERGNSFKIVVIDGDEKFTRDLSDATFTIN